MTGFFRSVALAGLAMLLPGCGYTETPSAPTNEQAGGNDTPLQLERAARIDAGLLELVRLDSTIKLDIRYATPNNVTGRVLYSQPRAFLIEDAAKTLVKISAKAKRKGVGLMIFDAYRPWRVTKALWDATPPAQRSFVANPKEGSRHNRGSAVDLTLYDLKTGMALPMPSEFDDFSTQAHRDYVGGTAQQQANRALLFRLMDGAGFVGRTDEWWHFDWAGWKRYPIMDVPFEEV
jgi:zinc D-Ala-D-Ala dipeptidase